MIPLARSGMTASSLRTHRPTCALPSTSSPPSVWAVSQTKCASTTRRCPGSWRSSRLRSRRSWRRRRHASMPCAHPHPLPPTAATAVTAAAAIAAIAVIAAIAAAAAVAAAATRLLATVKMSAGGAGRSPAVRTRPKKLRTRPERQRRRLQRRRRSARRRRRAEGRTGVAPRRRLANPPMKMVPAGDGMNAAGRRTHWRSGERETRRLMAGTGVGKSIQSASAAAERSTSRMRTAAAEVAGKRSAGVGSPAGTGA
mmetsp:Transcript_27415/g.74163  ORF Transcript_27415/g.74163 Transcript_27415/m.74163 type:complete len:255 (-) Transcript_27415:838-1602(-)